MDWNAALEPELMSSDELSENAIAVVGMAGRFPGSRSLAEFWVNLRNGVESITSFSDEELRAAGVPDEVLANPNYVKSGVVLEGFDHFDAGFFGFSPRDAEIMDPQQRVFLECAWEALEHAGHDPARFTGSIGVFAGSGMTAYMTFNLAPNRELMDGVGLFLVRHTGNDKDFLATRVSYEFDLKGPSLNVQTACSTSLVAIHLAAQHLLSGECDMALAGGVTIEVPHRVGYLYKENEILAPDGHCRAFDAESRGTVFGSGAGVVVLRRHADAVRDGDQIHAVILGSAVNNDGSAKVGYLAPSVDGQAASVAEAISIAGVSPETITYIETHGTGTPVGDPIEVAALTQAFQSTGASKRAYCSLGSLKTNIGHLDTAAGVAAFIKTVLALQNREIPPSLHYRSPNPAIDFENSPFFVNATLRPWTSAGARRAGVSSLGVGGTNAHVIVQEPAMREAGSPGRPWQLIPISAKTPTALDNAAANLADHLRENRSDFADVAWTLQEGRQAFSQRRFLVARDREETVDIIERNASTRVFSGSAQGTPSIAFMFAGGGSQHPSMARDLYASEPVFRREVDRCLDLLKKHVSADLRSILFPAAGDEERAAREIERPSRALPLLFTVQFAQAQLWRSWGIEPSGMIGHSMGEYTAACLAGVFSLEDALAVVALRGRLFESLPPGGMVSVPLSPDQLRPLLDPALSIAAVNAPEISVASGPVEALEKLERILKDRDLEARRIHISVAAHSAQLDPILGEFAAYMRTVTLRPPTLPFVSNLSGAWAGSDVTEPDYWVRHLRNTVQFADGLSMLLEDQDKVLLEIGPGRILATLARFHSATRGTHGILASLPHPDEPTSDAAFMLTTLGQLWLRGAAVDWKALHSDERRRRVTLPTYPFERQRYWIDAPKPELGVERHEPAARSADIADWFWEPVWRRAPVEHQAEPVARPGVLLFDGSDEGGIGSRVGEKLRAAGQRVVTVTLGRRFEQLAHDSYSMRPASLADATSLVRELAKEHGVPGRVLHLWTLGNATDATTDRERGFETLIAFTQALAGEDVDGRTTIVIGASGSQQVAGEQINSPARSLAIGAVRVIPREYPGITCRYVDVEAEIPAHNKVGISERFCEELEAKGPDLVAYRGRERLALDFAQVRFKSADDRAGLRVCGVYLITGGMGGLGGVVATELARRAQAKLALVSRRPLPPKVDWALWLATHDASDDTSRRIRLIMELEDAGAEVLPLAGDVTRSEDAASIVEETRRRFGAIHGIVHAAGVLDDGLLQVRTREQGDRVIRPKFDALLALEAALTKETLDFFVSFSSVSVLAGIPGQTDYAAANAFLDAHAQQRSARGSGRAISIAWSAWKDVGMLASMGRTASPTFEDAPTGEPIAINHPVLRRGVRSGSNETYSATLSPSKDWILGEHRLRDGGPLIPGTGYLELARAALHAVSNGGATEIRDVFFLKPFVVRDGESRELRLQLTREDDNSRGGDFVILGRAPGTPTWEEHVRGTVLRANGKTEWPKRMLLDQIKARCTKHDLDEAHPYLTFGPRWSNVRAIAYGADEALVALELPVEFHKDLDDFRLHPALLDMATAGAQRLIAGHDPAHGFFVPIGYGKVRLLEALPPRVYSHIRYRRPETGRSDVAIFDVTIANETGAVVADIVEFTMKRVSADALRASSDAAGMRGPSLVDLEDAITAEEGASAFFRILGADTAAHVVVSPRRLDGLLEQWRCIEAVPAPKPQNREEDPTVKKDLKRIAAALAEHAAVAESCAVAKKGRGNDRRIIGYVVYKRGESATISELRRKAKSLLPAHLVPANFIDLEAFPRRPDGAIDHAALPDPFGPIDDYVAPRTEMEKAIAQVWSEVLGVERVGAHDNFFDIGGHSLLSVRVITKLDKKIGVRLDQAIMVLQTLEQIAARCERRTEQTGEPSLPR